MRKDLKKNMLAPDKTVPREPALGYRNDLFDILRECVLLYI